MENIKVKIYGLYTNTNNTIRYVGKTKNTLEYRLAHHLSVAKKGNFKRHKDNWIRKEIENNNEIRIILLEECDEMSWEKKETFWIKKLKNKSKLTNATLGGEGGKLLIYKWSYNKLKKYIQSNFKKINSSLLYEKEFSKNLVRNKNIPICPDVVYKERGWVSWGDFLGTNRVQSNKVAIDKYLNYVQAKRIVQSLKINSMKEYENAHKSGKILSTIPLKPSRFYLKRGWVSWGDFLGTKRVANQYKKNHFYTFEESKEYLKNNFPSVNSRSKFYNIIKNNSCGGKIPSNPEVFYSNKWVSWGDFLNTNRISDKKKHELYLDYNECKVYVQANYQGIKSSIQWEEFWIKHIKPDNIPLHPENTYKKEGWTGWGEFLNTNNITNSKKSKIFLKYNEFVNYFKTNGICFTSAKNYVNFFKFNHRPIFITASPDAFYKGKGWVSWIQFLNSIKSN